MCALFVRRPSDRYTLTMKSVPLLAAAVVVLAACSSSAQSPRQPAPSDVVATVGTTPITLAEVDDKALNQPASNFGGTLSQALYDARRAAVDDLVPDRLIDRQAKEQ